MDGSLFGVVEVVCPDGGVFVDVVPDFLIFFFTTNDMIMIGTLPNVPHKNVILFTFY